MNNKGHKHVGQCGSICLNCRWGCELSPGVIWCDYGAYPDGAKYKCKYFLSKLREEEIYAIQKPR